MQEMDISPWRAESLRRDRDALFCGIGGIIPVGRGGD